MSEEPSESNNSGVWKVVIGLIVVVAGFTLAIIKVKICGLLDHAFLSALYPAFTGIAMISGKSKQEADL